MALTGLLIAAAVLGACAGPGAPGVAAVSGATAAAPTSGATAAEPASGPTTAAAATPTSLSPAGGSPRSITVAATGEILIHPSVWRQAGADPASADFRPVLAGARPLLADADIAVCHLETTIAPARGPFAGYPAFATPPSIVPAIAATGFDVCSDASNHSLDQGFGGIVRTLDALDASGIGHAGLARTAAEAAAAPTLHDVHGVRVAHLAYTRDLNGYVPPAGKEWAVNRLTVPRVLADARRARAAGADLVIVTLHHGTEYQTEPDSAQRAAVAAIAASPDVDLVLGHHAHVVQPVVRIGTTWVAYGLGNLVSGQSASDPRRREGVVLRWRFVARPDGRFVADRAEAYPTYNDVSPPRVVDVVSALAAGTGRPSYRAAYQRVRATVLAQGAAAAGMVVPSP